MKTKIVFFVSVFIFFVFSNSVNASTSRNYTYEKDFVKKSFGLALTPSISAFIASSNNRCQYDDTLKKIFFKGEMKENDYKLLLQHTNNPKELKEIQDKYTASLRGGGSGDAVIFLPLLLLSPIAMGVMSLSIAVLGFTEKPVESVVLRWPSGEATCYIKNNLEYVSQPLFLTNVLFIATKVNPFISVIGNVGAIYTFLQNDPTSQFILKAFPCDVFDKALYHSSLMSEELWAEFKLIGYFNDKDQLSDKFFADYKGKKLVIPSQFEPYKEGIYLAFDEYLSVKKNTDTPGSIKTPGKY